MRNAIIKPSNLYRPVETLKKNFKTFCFVVFVFVFFHFSSTLKQKLVQLYPLSICSIWPKFYRLLLFVNHHHPRVLQYHHSVVVARLQMYDIERPYEGQERQVYTQRSCSEVPCINTYLLGIILDFGLVPEVSMYHFPPVILTGKGFTNDSLTSKSLSTLASPRVI